VEFEGIEEGSHVVGVVADAAGGVDRQPVDVAEATEIDGDRPEPCRQVEHCLLPEQ
jgi:hypothetical protein